MRELGYVEGKNFVIEWRFAEGQMERLPGYAMELARLNLNLIVTAGNQGISAAQQSSTTIPVIMATSIDPVGSGFVKSLARPGGNITGLSNLSSEISAKHLEMLVAFAPKLSRVAILLNPTNSAHGTILRSVQSAAQLMRIEIIPVEARAVSEIEATFSMMSKRGAEAVIIAIDGLFSGQARMIVELAAKNRLLSIYTARVFVESGGLMNYGQNFADDYYRAATYVDKIFKGAKPSDLPVEQSTKFEMIINGKTAKTLGLKIPQSLQIMADKIIE